VQSLLLIAAAFARPPAGTWVPLPDGTAVCVSPVPDGTALGRTERLAREALVARMAAGEDPKALVEPVGAARTAHPDPAWDSLAVALSLALGSPDAPGAVALADAWPDDPCLGAAAASALVAAQGRRADPEQVASYVGRAWLPLAHPELARLLAGALLAEGETARAIAILDRWIAQAPTWPGLQALRAEAALASGDNAAGLAALMAMFRAGDHSRDAVLAEALYKAGEMGDYLRVMAALGAPLAGAPVADAADPLAALRGHLGLTAPGQELVALLETSAGTITCTLFTDQAPVTVANFWGLATGAQKPGPIYDGTKFHRVIPGFMIQGGDPLGTGEGGPGYAFPDEATPALSFDRVGRLAMANSGPDTNGSQFFVTVAETPHLNGKHTIFGQCGPSDVVDRIAAAPRDGQDRPLTPILLQKVTFEVR
jgi:peptidyl-prolyl cis-trans isomerase A (cyclophilin A)